MMPDDGQLLADFAQTGSAQAFRTLVERHLPLVYAAARRQMRDPAEADDIAQAVFIILARKAGTLPDPTLLSAWLLKIAHFTAANARKTAARRRHYEQEVAAMVPQSVSQPDPEWEGMSPHIDAALARLSERDRAAVLGHCVQQQSLPELAAALHLSEPAIRKRIQRALQRLRGWLPPHGTAPTIALPALLAAHLIPASPSSLSAAVLANTALAAAHGSLASCTALTLAKGTLNMLTFLKIKLAAMVTALILSVGITAIVGHRLLAKADDPRSVATTAPVPTTQASVETAEAKLPVSADAAAQKALADQIQAQEERLKRLQFTFQIREWDSTEAELEKHDPGQAAVRYTGVYAIDRAQQREHLRLDYSDQGYFADFFRQTEQWTQWRPEAPGNPNSYVNIARDIPADLNALDCRLARQLGYSHLNSLSLSQAVRTASDIEIISTKLGDLDTTRATLFVLIPARFEAEGQKHEGKEACLFRIWLDPQHGLLPLRIEDLSIEPPKGNVNLASWKLRDLLPPARTTLVQFQDEIKEAAPGIWLPRTITLGSVVPTRQTPILQLQVQNPSVNDKADVPSGLPIPAGTPVTNDITHTKYHWQSPATQPATQPAK